jgi:MOSC domain-containing protein YiiM
MTPQIISINSSSEHNVRKDNRSSIIVVKGLGIKDDAHSGATVKHEYLERRTPELPNLRQVHLISTELYQELKTKGFDLSPGELGENITTKNIDLINLPLDTVIELGDTVKLQLTGLRMPCSLLNKVQVGLMKAVLQFDKNSKPIPTCGVMSIVLEGGVVNSNDSIKVILPPLPQQALEEV